MFFFDPERITLEDKHVKLLKATTFREGYPGQILHDFGEIIKIFSGKPQELTKAHQLKLKVVHELNERISHPLELGLKRPVQKSYPHIHGLYLLLRASGIGYVEESGKKPKLVISDEMLKQWNTLNPTEQYGHLLESWLLRGKNEILNERGRDFGAIPQTYQNVVDAYLKLPKKGLNIAKDKEALRSIAYFPGLHHLALMELFGLVILEDHPSDEGDGWQLDRIIPHEFGEALLAVLNDVFFGIDLFFEYYHLDSTPINVFQPLMTDYMPTWEKTIDYGSRGITEGRRIFQVTLGKFSARIAIDGVDTLHDLAGLITAAVDFDFDHLYEFIFPTRFGDSLQIGHPHMLDGLPADEFAVNQVTYREGAAFKFIFDFGDWWEFTLILEKIDTDTTKKAKPSILETKGDAPKQYPNWDEDEE